MHIQHQHIATYGKQQIQKQFGTVNTCFCLLITQKRSHLQKEKSLAPVKNSSFNSQIHIECVHVIIANVKTSLDLLITHCKHNQNKAVVCTLQQLWTLSLSCSSPALCSIACLHGRAGSFQSTAISQTSFYGLFMV